MDCSSVVSKGNADNKLKNVLGIVFMLTRMKMFQLRVLECCCPPSPLGGLFFFSQVSYPEGSGQTRKK